jgi:hypothetical protein
MKKYLSIFILIFITFFVAPNALAQEKNVKEQEIINLKIKADDFIEKFNYREKSVNKNFRLEDGLKPYRQVTSVFEKTSKGHYEKREIETSDGNYQKEEIKIGDRKFIRQNNENWKEIKTEDENSLGGMTRIDNSQKSVEYKYLGKKEFNKQIADVYEIKTVRENKNSQKALIMIFTETFWLDSEGRFKKVEIRSEMNGHIIYSAVKEYEYDSNIRIEAPIK